jgi:hypothetical protein
MRRHIGQPLGVGKIGFSSRDVLHVGGVAQPQLLEEAFEGVVDGAPIDPGCLHGHRLRPGLDEELRERGQSRLGGGEALLGDLDLARGHRHPRTGDDTVTMDVEAAHLVSYLLHVHLLVVVGGRRERTTV